MPVVRLPCPLVQLVFVLLTLLAVVDVAALDFRYHDQEDIEQIMTSWSQQYPDLTHMYSIGKSIRGADLWVIVLGKNASQHSPLVPNVKYVANMHGNEVVGRELLLHLGEYLLTQYGYNHSLTQFLNTTHLHIMPTMNPDGFAVSREGSCEGLIGRWNALGYDLNRNFPDVYGTSSDPEQRETKLVRDWMHTYTFVLSANLHGGALVANYPFDSYPGAQVPSYSASPDDDVFRHLSLIYSRSHPTMHLGKSCGDSFKNGITNGANWYPVNGGMQDYLYRNASGYAILVEVSCCKYPKASMLQEFWKENKDALINLMFAVHMGVKGFILAQSQYTESLFLPVEGAVVVVEGRESVQFRTNKYGEYFKLLLPGDYILKVSHPLYQSTAVPFTVKDSVVTRLDIQLVMSKFNLNSQTMEELTSTSIWEVNTAMKKQLDIINAGESYHHSAGQLYLQIKLLASVIVVIFFSIL